MTFHRILLALDRTDQAEEIFERGVAIAAPLGSQLKLLHCLTDAASLTSSIDPTADWSALSWPVLGDANLAYELQKDPAQDERWQQAEAVAREWLQAYRQRAVTAGVAEVEADCVVGEPDIYICSLAAEWQADLIVVGRKGRSSLKETLLGSISSYVLHHAHCPVLMVPSIK